MKKTINSINHILKQKKFFNNRLTLKQKNFLEKNGYLIIKDTKSFWRNIGTSPRQLNNILDKLIKKEGIFAGSEGKEKIVKKNKRSIEEGAIRVSNLINKKEIFRKIAQNPKIINCLFAVLKDEIKLSCMLAREPITRKSQQEIHIDWFPRNKESEKYGEAIAIIYLDDSNEANGTTKLVPKSHKLLSYPAKYINPKIKKYKKEININVKSGSILICNSNIWHRGGENKNGKRRRAIFIDYRRRKFKQLLSTKKYLDNKIIKKLSLVEKYLFAVRNNDIRQKEDSFGPGNEYRKWLKRNPQFNY